jgi:hypothetical protein
MSGVSEDFLITEIFALTNLTCQRLIRSWRLKSRIWQKGPDPDPQNISTFKMVAVEPRIPANSSFLSQDSRELLGEPPQYSIYRCNIFTALWRISSEAVPVLYNSYAFRESMNFILVPVQ